jgi:hypothetical protein
MVKRVLGCTIGAILVFSPLLEAACGIERWPVKVASDSDASLVSPLILPVSIETLRGIPAPRPLPQDRRVAPVETTIYSVTATIIAYRLAPDSDIHMVLADELGRTIIARIPAPACAAESRFLEEITEARQAFEARFPPTETFKQVRVPVEARGIGFFDFLQSQQGLAPNGIGLQPVTYLDFTPPVRPKAPPLPSSRRRAVRAPGGCARPSLSISVSRDSVCGGEPTTVSWQASSSAASVSIDGIGAFLPSSGSRAVSVSASTAYSGHATSTCGPGDESVAVVNLKTSATATLSGPGSVVQGSTASLSVLISGATAWTLTSSLGNLISPSSGSTSSSPQYVGSRTGTDVVTLVATGGACGSVTRSVTIPVTAPTNSGLLCCDGTRSPTCFSCSSKQGCCSSHGGVCGCPKLVDGSEDVW